MLTSLGFPNRTIAISMFFAPESTTSSNAYTPMPTRQERHKHMHTDQGLAASYDSKQREGTQKQTNQRKGRKGRSKSRVRGGLTYSHLLSQRIGEEREHKGRFFRSVKPAAGQAVRSLQHAPHHTRT